MPESAEDPGLVLPIICPHCGKELNLGMDFALLPDQELDKSLIKNIDDINQ